MRPYLTNYIETLSGRRRERIGSLLEEARVGKEQLSSVLGRLDQTVAGGSALVLQKHRSEALIRSLPIRANVVSMEDRIEELFQMANAIGLLLNSHSAILSSDVKAIEDELVAMNKMVSNFAFLLADNQSYDYAYLETFTDELNRDTSLGAIPDRSSLPFGPADQAVVRTEEGALGLPESILNSHGMVGEIIKSNAGAFTISDTGLHNVLRKGNSTGWKKTILTAGPVTAPLPEAEGRIGAQVVLEFRLIQPAPCSEINLSPYADLSVELLQVTTFDSDEDAEGTSHLMGPKLLDRPYTLHFPMRPVSKFQIVLNQPTYHRVTRHEDVLEFRYHHLLESLDQRRETNSHTYKRVYSVHTIEQAILLDVMGEGQQSVSLPANNLSPDRGPMDIGNLVLAFRFDRPSLWAEGIQDEAYILFDVLQQQPNNNVNDINRYDGDFEITKNVRFLASDNPISQVVDKAMNTQVIDSGFTYYYNLGLHYVGIGVESPGFKGVYVSKPLPAPGDIGVVRIKTEEDNYFARFSARQSKVLTSVEYSVSNQSTPSREIDWRPILPINTNKVQGERLFLDEGGTGLFRFTADAASEMAIYRNGYTMSTGAGAVELIPGGQPGTLDGAKIALGSMAPEDIFTCDYYPIGDPTVLSFEDEDYRVPPLVSAFDEDGAGERFLSTSDRNLVTLASNPYIDMQQVAAGSYQPIVVQLDDGTVPQNLTDYRTRALVTLPADGYYYIHSGNTIMFNRPITTPFRVYYQYLQNNVRIRTVLRCNVQDFVSPRVDSVHLKAKTRNPDVRVL